MADKHIFKFTKSVDNTTKIVLQAEGIEIGKAYQLTGGFYKGKMMLVDWISFNKKIYHEDGKKYRQISGTVVSVKVKYNTISAHLTSQVVHSNSPLGKLSNLSIIRAAKTGNKKAVCEFIRRFKKLPKINK